MRGLRDFDFLCLIDDDVFQTNDVQRWIESQPVKYGRPQQLAVSELKLGTHFEKKSLHSEDCIGIKVGFRRFLDSVLNDEKAAGQLQLSEYNIQSQIALVSLEIIDSATVPKEEPGE